MKLSEEIRRHLRARWPWALVEDLEVFGDAEHFHQLATSLPVLRGSNVLAQEVLYLRDGRFVLLRELETTRAPDLDDLAGLVEGGDRREGEEGSLLWVLASGLPAVGEGPSRELHAFVVGSPALELYAPSGDETQGERADMAIEDLDDPDFDVPEGFDEAVDALLLEALRSRGS